MVLTSLILLKFQSEIEAYKKSRDESDADRENEIRRIFSDPLNTSGSGQENPEANMSMENDRLKNDLNQVHGSVSKPFKS